MNEKYKTETLHDNATSARSKRSFCIDSINYQIIDKNHWRILNIIISEAEVNV